MTVPGDDSAPPSSRPLAVLGAVLLAVGGFACGVYECLLVPLRIGSTIFPLAVVLAIATNLVLPTLSRRMLGIGFGAVLPLGGWIVAVGASVTAGPGGDVILPGGSTDTALTGYAVMGLGFIAGIISIVRPDKGFKQVAPGSGTGGAR